MIKEAIEFVVSKVHRPALANSALPAAITNKIARNKVMIENFKKIGDLYLYLQRFSDKDSSAGGVVFDALTSLNLESIETIVYEFQERFSSRLRDFTMLDDFVIGEVYSSFDIAIFSKTYNVMQGIYPVGNEPNYEAIFTKVTLDGDGSYPNEWIREGVELKHYMKSINGNFSIDYKVNRAIINAKNYPIYVFVKTGTNCTLQGIFSCHNYERDESGGIWFRLIKSAFFEADLEITQDAFNQDLEAEVAESLNDTAEDRGARLKMATPKPTKQTIKVFGYRRNPDVVAEVLLRAGGICEGCKNEGPFIGKKRNEPFLEVHHKQHLANGGDDTVKNAIALCPNCHRELHLGVGY